MGIRNAISIIFIVSLFIPVFASAQTFIPQGIQEQLSATVSPKNPGTYQDVTISLESYSRDLNALNIRWYVNGTLEQSGIGQKKFQTKTKGSNERITVRAVIDIGVVPLEKTFVFKPAEVDLIYQAYTTVPAFYKGKALFTHQAPAKITTIPHITGSNGVEIAKENLIYKWTIDGTLANDQSGYGKYNINVFGSILSKPISIRVEVSDPKSEAVATGELTLNPSSPQLFTYEDHPLYGTIYSKAIVGDFLLTSDEIKLSVAPYFFALDDIENTEIVWKINGEKIETETQQTEMTFGRSSDEAGRSLISLSASQKNKLLQSAITSFNILYDEK